MTSVEAHKRVNDILLGRIERPVLRWLAGHMPLWVTPDILTAVGLVGSIMIFVSYWLTQIDHVFLWFASLGFFLNWFGDSLDGNLARYRKIERPKYGFFVDHMVDSFSMVLVFTGIGLSPYIRFEIAGLAMVGYLLMSILVYVGTVVNGVFKISFGKIGPTEVRVLAVLINTLVFFIGNRPVPLFGWEISIYDLFAIVFTICIYAIFIGSTLKQARRLSRLDP